MSRPGGQDPRVAVVGATGAVGTTMLQILRERSFPAAEVVAFASERSVGRELDGLTVRALGEDALGGFDLALMSAGSATAREWAPRLVESGAVVIDNSSCWRMADGVPLVVAGVNSEALDAHGGIIANPNCSVMQLVMALKPIADAAGLERVVVSTYQSTSGTGARAMQELRDQTHALLHEMEPDPPAVYPHRIAFNVLPHVEVFKDGDDYTTEERKVMGEARKILADPALRITATCARVPTLNCHAQSVNVQTREELSPERCRELLAAAPGIAVADDPGSAVYPLPVDAAGRDEVFVGRVRRDESNDHTLNLWIVADNLRKGAALNAIQLAELLRERGLLGAPAARAAAPQ